MESKKFVDYSEIMGKLFILGFNYAVINSNIYSCSYDDIVISIDTREYILLVMKGDKEVFKINNKTILQGGKKYWTHPPTVKQFGDILIWIRDEKFNKLLE